MHCKTENRHRAGVKVTIEIRKLSQTQKESKKAEEKMLAGVLLAWTKKKHDITTRWKARR